MRRLLFVIVCAALASVCRTPEPPASSPVPDLDPRITTLLGSISEERLEAMLQKLVSFETRHLASDPSPAGQGIGAAREWMLQELTSFSPKLQVSFDTYRIPPQGGRILRDVELRNVMAVLPGRSPRRIYVSGHYDSLARLVNPPASAGPPGPAGMHWNVPDSPAPGADDDGSGTVLTMELARVFAESGLEFDATLVFICWAGEEQGLIGSAAHAQNLVAAKATVEALFNNDIVGNSHGGNGVVDAESVRVYAVGPEDSTPQLPLCRPCQPFAMCAP